MTTRRKSGVPRLRITQVRSIIGNQERVKRVVTDGLGLGRIGSSVVLLDNSYTRGMIAKAAHIVKFEELAAEVHAHTPEPSQPPVPEAVEKLVEAAVAPIEKAPRREKLVEAAVAPIEKAPRRKKASADTKAKAKPTSAPAKTTRKRTAPKSEE